MGAADFQNFGKGFSPDEAFRDLVEHARHEHGHGGYSGTIAEKRSFVMVIADGSAVAPLREKRLAHLAETLREWQAAKVGGKVGTQWSYTYVDSEKQKGEKIAAIESEIATLQKGGMTKGLAMAYANHLMETNDRRVSDKWGPAACIIIREPSIKKYSAAEAAKLAQAKWGEKGTVTIKTQRATKGGQAYAYANLVTKTYQTQVGYASGKDVEDARNKLLSEPGEYFFFGLASG